MPSSRPTQQTKADLELDLLRAQTRRANALAEFQELKAEEERWLQAKEDASAYEHRIYHFIEPVYDGSVAHCMDTLGMWSRLDPRCDLTVVLNSPGGLIFEGLALYDALDELKDDGHKLTVVVRGMAASMGGILLQAASDGERVVGRNAHVMIHELSDVAYGKHSVIKDATKFNETVWDRLAGILAERSTMSKLQVKRRADRKDWWMNADEAVKLGFADRIG